MTSHSFAVADPCPQELDPQELDPQESGASDERAFLSSDSSVSSDRGATEIADSEPVGERIAKFLSRCGVCSRRDAERFIAAGRVAVNGHVLDTPAYCVCKTDHITVDGKPVANPDIPRLWRYYKPEGLVTTHHDPQGRPTVFAHLPPTMPRVMSVGRLDLNSEGLLLLTNDGELARHFEHPQTKMTRRYRVRVYGSVSQQHLQSLAEGITVDGIHYGPVTAVFEKQTGRNSWLTVSLQEGKNREIRRIMQHLGYHVNRLIRVAYGTFVLGNLSPGDVEEIPGYLVAKIDPRNAAGTQKETKPRTGWAKPSKPKVRPGYKKYGQRSEIRETPPPIEKSRTFFRLSETNKMRQERRPRDISEGYTAKPSTWRARTGGEAPHAPERRRPWKIKKREEQVHPAFKRSGGAPRRKVLSSRPVRDRH